jgi:hypothetical protein
VCFRVRERLIVVNLHYCGDHDTLLYSAPEPKGPS